MRSLRGYGSILSAPNREMQAGMAQSVERHIGSVEVPGPIPGASSQKKADRNCVPSFVLPFCSVSLQGGRGSICFSAEQRAGLSPDLETDLPAFCFLCFPSARPSPSLTPTSRCRTNAGPGKQVPARNPLSACHCLNYLLQPSRCAWQHRADPSKQAQKAVSEKWTAAGNFGRQSGRNRRTAGAHFLCTEKADSAPEIIPKQNPLSSGLLFSPVLLRAEPLRIAPRKGNPCEDPRVAFLPLERHVQEDAVLLCHVTQAVPPDREKERDK